MLFYYFYDFTETEICKVVGMSTRINVFCSCHLSFRDLPVRNGHLLKGMTDSAEL